MPSKGKKSSNPDRSPASRTPPSTPSSAHRIEPDRGEDELHFRNLLARASAKFPRFIGESAFVGRICCQDLDLSKGNQARVWISDSAMASSSLSPGSLVSVSLPASGVNSSGSSPLDSLTEECSRNFKVVVCDDELNVAGKYFAIATVLPSREIVKDGVRLSAGLSWTMGFLLAGRSVFVFPFINSDHLKKKNRTTQENLHKCMNLYLNLISLKDVPVTDNQELSSNDTSAESPNVRSKKGRLASPRTPSYRTSLSSSGATDARPRKSDNVTPGPDFTRCSDVSSVRLALTDEKTNELLRKNAAMWLFGRYLLSGNIASFPLIFGHICIFQVESADELQNVGSIHGFMHEEKLNALNDEAQVCGFKGKTDVAFLVGTKTNVYLRDPLYSDEVNQDKTGALEEYSALEKEDSRIPRLGGLSEEFANLKEIIAFSLSNKGNLPRYKGVLLHGPPGTGKTSLASACARDAGATLFPINGPEIVSEYYGESEQALHETFDSARRAAPSVVFIDELDAIAPTRKDGGEELSLRMVATLLKLMDEIKREDHLLVIAATNQPDSIDPAMRRPGRLDREIEIGVPSPEKRLDILHTLLSGIDHSLSNMVVQNLASETHGFVGADLAALCNEAAMTALRRHIKSRKPDKYLDGLSSGIHGLDCSGEGLKLHRSVDRPSDDVVCSLSSSLSELTVSVVPKSADNSQGVQERVNSYPREPHRSDRAEGVLLKVSEEDFMKAKMKVRPSAMREVMLELPKVQWEDVGGQEKVKKQLIEAVQWPQICPDAFTRIGIHPPRGLLMIGPPGCSKTLMARAVASEAKLNFLAVKGPELFRKWVGESEKAVRNLFAKARANSPAIIFFDEIDGLAVSRGQENDGTSVADRVLSQLLVEMDGLNQRVGVTVIAATNRPDKIDPALLRPGRFDRLIDVQPPDESDREEIFRVHTRNLPCQPNVSMEELAHLTEGYTGADIKLICRETALAALEENLEISEVSMEHFKIGIGRVHPSDLQFYKELATQFRRVVDNGPLRDG